MSKVWTEATRPELKLRCATAALQALVGNVVTHDAATIRTLAEHAWAYGEAMLAELDRRERLRDEGGTGS